MYQVICSCEVPEPVEVVELTYTSDSPIVTKTPAVVKCYKCGYVILKDDTK
jgi:hypothetical protein